MATVAATPLDSDLLIATIDEFYTTTDEQRRHEIDSILCRFKTEYECVQTVGACMRIISQSASSSSVRYFGAVALYDVIRIRSEECIANETLQLSLKTFLIDSLTSDAYAPTTSVLNKLSATLALFALHCVPDLWATPVQDLTTLLAQTPEILLKVLSDMAAEFSHVSMPLAQRRQLKKALHSFSENIIQVLAVVLRGGDASSITKQAAVECVEQWLRLPEIELNQWTPVLSDVLGAVVQDCAALASILGIIAENDEFHNNSSLIMNICQYICVYVSGKIEEELRENATSEEIATLVSATCSVAEKSVPTIVECAAQGGDIELAITFSNVMKVLANIPGQYPLEEMVSDLPSAYFMLLRSEIMLTIDSNTKFDKLFTDQITQIYAQILDIAVGKLTFPSFDSWLTWNLEEREQFESYRKARSEVSYDLYRFSAAETLNFLNEQLEEALNSGSVNRSESCLYLWECVADYLAETDYPQILKCLQICASSSLSAPPVSTEIMDVDLDRRGATLMRLFYALSHLIQEHDNAQELECAVIPIVLMHINTRVMSVKQAIGTLQKFVEDLPECLDVVGDQISTTCYEFFNSTTAKDSDRLAALKCIGYVLSRKKSSDTMKIIGQILNQQNINEPGIDNQTRHRRYAFQINIFSSLFASLTCKKESNSTSMSQACNEEPTIVQLLREAIPVFEELCSGQTGLQSANNGTLIQEVCKAVRTALSSLPEKYLPSFFPFVVSLLNAAFFVPESVAAACTLANSAILLCGPLVGVEMANAFTQWIQGFEQQMGSPQFDEYLQVISQAVRKNWKLIRKFPEPSMKAFQSAINICSSIIINSAVPTEVRSASQILAALSTYTTSYDDSAMKNAFAEEGPLLIRAVFNRVQAEVMRLTVEALADVLYFYFKEFTTETRALLNSEPYGSSALITAMFREIGDKRKFTQQTIRFNLAAVRDPGNI